MRVAYICYPFSIRSQTSVNAAKTELLKIFGKVNRNQPNFLCANAIFEAYQATPLNDKIYYAAAGVLIQAAAVVIVIKAKGWEYSEHMMQEVSYANMIGKPIHYMEPIPNESKLQPNS